MSVIFANRYEISKLIGKGGMADVYLAYDRILNREVAIKVLKSDMSDDPLALKRFQREAGATCKLSHPNIVDVYDVGDDADRHFIVMEYIKGYTLKQLIKKRKNIPFKEAVWIVKQLVAALMEAHRNGIIHRDIKSQNVLIKADGTIKIADFGIALASDAIQITKKDSVLGSVHYLAPELAKGQQATMQSDIYSLGIVFFEMLTGDVPYKGENAVQVALKHMKCDIPSVRKFDHNIPQSVENIIIKATQKDLNKRYKNVALMLKDLNDCLKSEHLNDPIVTFEENNKVENIRISDKINELKNNKKVFNTLYLVAVSVFSIAALFLVLFLTGFIGNQNKVVKVPNIIGLTIQEARDQLALSELEVDDSRITWVLTDNVEKNLIIDVIPSVGTELEKGSKIKIVVSNGTYSILSSYVGKDYLQAKKELENLNFFVKLIPVEQEEQRGKVIAQSLESGYKYDQNLNNEISLTYAVGESLILDLALKGQSLSDVINYFEKNGINYELIGQGTDFFTEKELKNVSANTLIKTEPELGSLYAKDDEEVVKVYYWVGE